MTMCELMTDRMPGIVHGRARWSEQEQQHLASCEACRAEWELVSRASLLGEALTVDPSQVTTGVLSRLHAARTARMSAFQSPAIQLVALAAAAILLAVIVPNQRSTPEGMTAVPSAPGLLQLAELDDAAPDDLEEVLAVFDVPVDPESSLNGADMEGITDAQVESALRSWEESGG